MKTNLFKVKEKKEKKIVIEEEQYKLPLILFLRRYRKLIFMILGGLIICLLLITGGFAFSLFGSSSDLDITYLSGEETITPNPSPDIDDDVVHDALTGRGTEGVILLVETFMTSNDDVITYYSDGTAIVVQSDGTTYRVYPTPSGEYGVDRRGKFLEGAIKNKVSSKTETLADGTVITHYSDGSARVTHDDITIFVRNEDNVVNGNNNSNFKEVSPSGVSLETSKYKRGGDEAVHFTDDTYMVERDGKKSIVNRNTKVDVNDDGINYDKNNSFGVLEERKLKDGRTVTYFEDGSAVIEDENGRDIYVHKSGDIVVKDDKVFEIVPNARGNDTYKKRCPDGKTVTYYDNGSAVIEDENGNKSYVEDNRNIIYGDDGNIEDIKEKPSPTKKKGKMDTGEDVTIFDNGKAQIEEDDGDSYIVDGKDIKIKEDDGDGSSNGDNENLEEEPKEDEDKNDDNEIDTSDIYVSDAENSYREEYNIQDTVFTIRNSGTSRKKFRIVIEEVSDYNKYNTSRLDPQFVKFQAVVGGNYIGATRLDSDTWTNDGRVNYVIYDGIINGKSTIDVALSLYVDYAPLDNSYQNKGFVGTIKVYLVTDDKK